MNPILFLHGALGTKNQFDAIVSKLESTRKVYAFNFEGHGDKSSNRPFSIDLFVQNVREFVDEYQLQKVDVFGYSMGGYVALNCAIEYPERIGSITTFGTKFDWSPTSAASEVKLLNPEIIEKKVPKFAEKLSAEHGNLNWKNVMHKTANLMLVLGNGQAMSEEDFLKIKHNVLIIRGSEDTMVSTEESKKVAQLMLNAEFIELEKAPHMLEKVNVDMLIQLLHLKLKSN